MRFICPSHMAVKAYAPHGSIVSAPRASASWLCMSMPFHIPVRFNMPIDQNAKPSWRNPTQVNNARSFLALAAGVLTGLILAGYSLFTARSTSTVLVPAEDVALVNQQPLSRTDYLALLQTLYGVDLSHATPEQRRKVLDDMIREELFVQRGKELDVASTDPDVRGALVNAVELEMAENAITSQPSEVIAFSAISSSTAFPSAPRTSGSVEATSSSLPRCTNSSSRIMSSRTLRRCSGVAWLKSTPYKVCSRAR